MVKFFKSRKKTFSFKCSDCGELHTGSPSLYQKRPTIYLDIVETEREKLTMASDDLCIVFASEEQNKDDAQFAIRTILEMPINGIEEPMLLGVWVTQSQKSFEKYVESFDDEQSDFKSFGWLHINQPHYETRDDDGFLLSLGCDVIGQCKGQRPKLVLHDAQHELVRDQRNGVSWKKAEKIYRKWIH